MSATDSASPRPRFSGSHKAIKNYDRSPIMSPTSTPPLSRNNSSSSINSVRSEPAQSSKRPQRGRQNSEASVKTNDSHKSLMSFFKRDKKPKDKKEIDKIVLTSRHAAAVKTKMQLDPEYKAFLEKHKRPNVKTAGISGGTRHSSHSTAAEQEARHPHSGPVHVTTDVNMPMLTRIQSGDEDDPEVDPWERSRREWNEAKEHNLTDINEAVTPAWRSPAGSRIHSPIASRDPSPSRRPQPRSRNSWIGGGYYRTESGTWTKRDTPPQNSRSPSLYGSSDLHAQSLTERLKAIQ